MADNFSCEICRIVKESVGIQLSNSIVIRIYLLIGNSKQIFISNRNKIIHLDIRI